MHTLKPTLFIRHHRALRAAFHHRQVWLCTQDFSRLMGYHLSPRHLDKLDDDQHITARLELDGRFEEQVMISESGAYALLVHHSIPENRALRYWLTHEVVAEMQRQGVLQA